MWKLLTNLVGWTGYLSTPPISNEISPETINKEEPDKPLDIPDVNVTTLENNWEWMLSTAEEAVLKQEQQRAQDIRKELEKITRVSSSVKQRPKIGSLLKELYRTLGKPTVYTLEQSRLDASKRDRVLRDALRKVSSDWLTEILFRLPTEKRDAFVTRWHEQPYKKNICGEMVSLALHSSHLAGEKGLTVTILSDILWSLHLCLSRELAAELNRDLTVEELDFLTSKAIDISHEIIDLWEKTTVAMGTISKREGRLPSQWKTEVKTVSGIDARFSDGPADPLWNEHQTAIKQKTIEKPLDSQVFANRRQMLAMSLCLGAQPGKQVQGKKK